MDATASVAKKRYKVTNWREYNRALVNRGDFTLWFSDDVLLAWEHENGLLEDGSKKNGRPFFYSDLAVETLLTIRELFRLPYRQTEGFGKAVVEMLDARVKVPHHTSLQKRAGKLGVAIRLVGLKGPIDVVVDSTGLKVYGDGEWKVRQHGAGKRRTWRKVHLAVDPDSHAILAQLTTDSGVHDGEAVEPLLKQVEPEVRTFYGDGAFDSWKVRDHLRESGIDQIIPPRKGAKIKQHGNSSAEPLERDECLRQIRREGKKAWAESIGYHRRSLVETAMSRLKGSFGERLRNREGPNQATEVALRCKLLNHFVLLGMPISLWG